MATPPQTTMPTYSENGFLGSDPSVNRLYDNVQAMVPMIGLPIIKMMAWNTVEEFYMRSTARREQVHWQMAIGVQSIDFNPFDETWLVAWVLAVSGLHRYRVIMPGKLVDLQYPANPRHGEVLLALKPVDFSTNLPDELFQNWFEGILDGTLFRISAVPNKPYTNPQMASYHGARFRAAIGRARAIAQHDFTDSGGRWSFPQAQGFAMGRRKN